MLDIKLIRKNPELLKKAVARTKERFDVDGFL
jgi:seryl-tRNA synthetase